MILGIRPEDVVERPATEPAAIRGRIASVLPIGSDEYLGVAFEGVDCFFRVGKEVHHAAGEPIALDLNRAGRICSTRPATKRCCAVRRHEARTR